MRMEELGGLPSNKRHGFSVSAILTVPIPPSSLPLTRTGDASAGMGVGMEARWEEQYLRRANSSTLALCLYTSFLSRPRMVGVGSGEWGVGKEVDLLSLWFTLARVRG